MQRYSDLSFFLTKRTRVLYKKDIGWMKPILRFFLINFFRASCLDAEKE